MKSYSETTALTCPHCARNFDAPIWLIVDAHEHPELLDAVCMEQINSVACPSCGHQAAVPAPLLLHDGVLKCVLFIIPPETNEQDWRQQGEALHRLLLGTIPLDQRDPYLDNLIFVEKIGEAVPLLLKMGRAKATNVEPISLQQTTMPIQEGTESAGNEALYTAIQAAVLASTPEQIKKLLDTYPVLLGPASETALSELTEAAFEQQEFTLVQRLQSLRRAIREAGLSPDGLNNQQDEDSSGSELTEPTRALPQRYDEINHAVDLLLNAPDHDAIAKILVDYPIVMSEDAAALLGEIAARARDRGDAELAGYALEYRDFLRQVREGLNSAPSR